MRAVAAAADELRLGKRLQQGCKGVELQTSHRRRPDPCRGTNRGTKVPAPKTRLAHVKTLETRSQHASRLGIVPLATSPKRSMGHLLGGEKIIFLIRDIDGPAMAAAPVESCQDRGPEVSLGSPRIGTRRGQSPTPHTRALRSVDTYQYRFSARRRA